MKDKDLELEIEKQHILIKNWVFEELEKHKKECNKKLEEFQKRQDKILITTIIILLCIKDIF